jgi:uncharacterized cofD-like protein
MLRLLQPGIHVKRWLLILLVGMIGFALGLAFLVRPELTPQQALWHAWYGLTHQEMPRSAPTYAGVLFLVMSFFLVWFGLRNLVHLFAGVAAANPGGANKDLVQALLDRHRTTPLLRVVGLGGGTGLSTLLRGLKEYPVELTAVVTVSDDGGSSGRLRTDMDMPPPGDIRHCLTALAETEPLMEGLFQHRFAVNGASLDGHSLGNLIIAGLQEITGDFQQAIREASKVLAVRGRVLPSTNRPLVLKAIMEDGREVVGETAITGCGCTIREVYLDPPDAAPLPETMEALREADVIIVGPGSVYTSLLPNLLIPGVADALIASPAIKIFVCNVMTQPGESDGFTASRHLEAVLEHLPCPNPFHYAVVNLQRPPQDVMALYEEKGQHFVEPDLARLRTLGTIPLTAALLADLHLARHDHVKLARCILEHVAREARWPKLLKRRK